MQLAGCMFRSHYFMSGMCLKISSSLGVHSDFKIAVQTSGRKRLYCVSITVFPQGANV